LKKRLLFLVNVDWFFLSHRLPIALEALKHGYEVHVATGITDKLSVLRDYGFVVHSLNIERSSIGLMGEARSFIEIYRLFKKIRPDIVHLVTIKPVLFGGIAVRLTGGPAAVAAISGMGTLFVPVEGKAGKLKQVIQQLYRFALGHPNSVVIFQNLDDKAELLKIRAIRPGQERLIRGSGVDLNKYTSLPEPDGPIVVTMVARLLRDKGVYEFFEAARLLRARGVEAEFRLIGSPDPDNLTSVSAVELHGWREKGWVRILGFRDDIPQQYAESHIVCLPSYREGLPKSLVEAAACGRAVVTTDVPGCRDAIEPGRTGVLVPARDPVALADALQQLIENAEVRKKMGKAGRELAEREFKIEKIVAEHLKIYRELLEAS